MSSIQIFPDTSTPSNAALIEIGETDPFVDVAVTFAPTPDGCNP
jgi:hypothetical protein